jgi:hypothetical protein
MALNLPFWKHLLLKAYVCGTLPLRKRANLLAARRAVADHEVETVGRNLRNMMPFLVAKTPEDDQ